MTERYRLSAMQKDAIYTMECMPSLGVFLSAGCGKTAVALYWLVKRFRERRIEDALIVCPASLVPNWEQSIGKMIMFEDVTPRDVKELRDRVTIRSFQRTYRTERIPTRHRDGTVDVKVIVHLRDDVDKRWGALIIDEAHAIGSHSSQQGKAARTLARLSTYRYILTGTPVSGGGGAEDFSKLFGELEVLQPGIFGTWSRFVHDYVTEIGMYYKPKAYNVQKCRRLLEDHAIVGRLEDAYDMPGTTETDIPCPLAAKRPYDDMRKGRTEGYGVTIKTAGGQYPRMLQVCSGSLKADSGEVHVFRCSKDDALRTILDGTDDPVVVFCNYRASVDRAAEVCRKAGRRTAVFDGRMPKAGTPPWMDFQSGKADAIVCQYQSGGVGIDLYRSHTMVLFEPCYSALLLTQSLARTYRKGQTAHCLYYFLTTQGTVEERTWRTVRSGKDVTEKMMADWAAGGLDL